MDYKEVKETIDRIVKSIKKGNYSVSYDEPNNIICCTAPNGRTFYKVESLDDARSSTDFGSCTVDVEGMSFRCDWEYGEYDSNFFDEMDDQYELSDGSCYSKEELIDIVVDAFNTRRDIFFGEYSDTDSQMDIYAEINHIKNPEYYWWEDEECPVDIDNGWYTEPKECDYGTVFYNHRKYYLVQEPNNKDGEQLLAVHCKEKPDDRYHYKTVLLKVLYGKNGRIKVSSCEESDEIYDADSGFTRLP